LVYTGFFSNKEPEMPDPLVKPYPEFPLTPHKMGYWVKVVNGKQRRFGSRWCHPDEALEDWMATKRDLIAGNEPEPDCDGLTLRDALRIFLTYKKKQLTAGTITQKTYTDYNDECKRIRDAIGPSTPLESIGPRHFEQLHKSFNGTPITINNKIGRVRVIFKYFHDAELIDKPVRYGVDFKRASAKTLRLERAKKPKKLLTPEQIKVMLKHSNPTMRAMIWLGLYAGFGNTDCATVLVRHFHGEWVEYHRPKTGIQRKAWIPPEPLKEINAVMQESGVCFRTKYGNTWDGSPISAEWKKVADICKVDHGFYALRHTCETIGGRCKDQVAVDYVMGHVTPGMSSIYREEIDDSRVKAVGEAILNWMKNENKRPPDR